MKYSSIERDFRFAEIDFEVGDIEVGFIDREKLSGLRFANVKRMTTDLQMEILEFFAAEIGREGLAKVEPMNGVKQISRRPDLFGRLLEKDPDFANIEILVIPVLGTINSSEIVRQIALVRPSAVVSAMTQNTSVGEGHLLVLPDEFVVPEMEPVVA